MNYREKQVKILRFLLVLLAVFVTSPVIAQPAADGIALRQSETPPDRMWHHPLYLNWGGYWKSRIRVTCRNQSSLPFSGFPLALRVIANGSPSSGKLPEIPLAGRDMREIRVCDSDGAELLWAAYDSEMSPLQGGALSPQDWLVVPMTCPANGNSELFIYFDNPQAGEVPDYLSARSGPVNCGVERGEGATPFGWQHDEGDEERRAYWSDERPHSGKKCLATEVKSGAKPSWIATRQYGIAVIPGAHYRFRAWVRAENVEGYAGWYLHVGNEDKPMMMAPTISGGGGTYDWKQVEFKFTAPEEATTASLGTVLWGTGRAWFDDVEWEMDTHGQDVVVHLPESCQLAEVDLAQSWPLPRTGRDRLIQRLHLEFLNFETNPRENVLACLNSSTFAGRQSPLDAPDQIRLLIGDQAVKPLVVGQYLMWPDRFPAKSRVHRYIYSNIKATTQQKDKSDVAWTGYVTLLNSQKNLVQNSSFERGENAPEAWIQSGVGQTGVRFSTDRPNLDELGQRAARLDVAAGTRSSWRGWQQEISVSSGATYFVAGWLKCRDLEGEARIHIHFHDAQGQLVKLGGMTSIGPGIGGTQDWTLLSGLVKVPSDATTLTLHLTMNTTGTLWHDGVVVAEVVNVSHAKRESAPMDKNDFVVWQVPSVVKVFQDDAPSPGRQPIRVCTAKGEWEVLQLAVRSGTSLPELQIVVNPPSKTNGKRLERFDVSVVGYVPVDYPTNYYRFDGPAWHRKLPQQPPGSDGWSGWWPDPLLPQSRFALSAESTQAVWVIFKISREAEAGDYLGTVRFVSQGNVLAEVPFAVHVWDYTIPEKTTFPAIYDVRLGPGGRIFGASLDQLYREIVQFMAERRLCPDKIRPDPVIEYRNGQVHTDFSEYDKVAQWYFGDLGLPVSYMPQLFYLFGWGFPPRDFFGQTPYPGTRPFEGADRRQLRPEYKAAYQACLKAYWEHVKQNGWADRVVLYISDEPFNHLPEIEKQMVALCEMIHEVDPQIPIYSSTWHHVPEWDGSITLWGLGHSGHVPPEKLRALMEGGAGVWFTTDGQMCIDTPYCAVERLLPHYCFHYGVSAYEFWGVAWTTYDPYRFGWHSFIPQSDQPGNRYWVRYPNGDGFLIYPGKPIGYDGLVSSIRLEQAREGVEDFEYLKLLKEAIEKLQPGDPRRQEAETVLATARQLVPIPNAGGRYLTQILPDPEVLERVRNQLGEIIEKLLSQK